MPYRETAATRAARAHRVRTLLEAGRRIVAGGGFGTAGVRAVAAEAGVSAGSVYTYFGGLDELLAQVFREAAATELAAVRAAVAAATTAPARLAAVIDTFAGRAIHGRTLAWALLAEPVGPLIDVERLAFRRAYAELLADIVAAGVAAGTFPPQDPTLVGAGLVGAIGEALVGPLSPLAGTGPTGNPEAIVDAIHRLCLRAVGAPEHSGRSTP